MDDSQARRINKAAQRFAAVLMESYRMVTDRTVSTQQLNAELMQNFFEAVIDNLRAQAEGNQEMIRDLVSQQRRQQQAAQWLAQESANAYMGFLDSMFYFYRRSTQGAERSIGESQDQPGEAEGDTREYFRNIMRETRRRSAGEA